MKVQPGSLNNLTTRLELIISIRSFHIVLYRTICSAVSWSNLILLLLCLTVIFSRSLKQGVFLLPLTIFLVISSSLLCYNISLMSFLINEVKVSITCNGHVSINSSLIWLSCLNSFIFLSVVYSTHTQYVTVFCLIAALSLVNSSSSSRSSFNTTTAS